MEDRKRIAVAVHPFGVFDHAALFERTTSMGPFAKTMHAAVEQGIADAALADTVGFRPDPYPPVEGQRRRGGAATPRPSMTSARRPRRGVGAGHQLGWTALVAPVIDDRHRRAAEM